MPEDTSKAEKQPSEPTVDKSELVQPGKNLIGIFESLTKDWKPFEEAKPIGSGRADLPSGEFIFSDKDMKGTSEKGEWPTRIIGGNFQDGESFFVSMTLDPYVKGKEDYISVTIQSTRKNLETGKLDKLKDSVKAIIGVRQSLGRLELEKKG